MRNINFTAEQVNGLLVKANSMPDTGDIATRTFTGATYQPKGDYLDASAIASYATLAAIDAVNEELGQLRRGLAALASRFNTLVGEGDVSSVVDTFNEMEAFLSGVANTDTLVALMAAQRAEIVALIPTGTARQTDLSSVSARVAQLEATSATHTTSITGLQTDVAKRPAVPDNTEAGAVYAVKDGSYICLVGSDEVLLSTERD